MNRTPTKLHGVADYATSALLLAAPALAQTKATP